MTARSCIATPTASVEHPPLFVKMEAAIRNEWIKGDAVQIHSSSKNKWFDGKIACIFTDEEGQWLEVRYGKHPTAMLKQVQRHSPAVRPAQVAGPNKRQKKATAIGRRRQQESQGANICKAQQLSDALKLRNEQFRRNAPLFLRKKKGVPSPPASTFTYPATKYVRRKRALFDLIEATEIAQPRPDASCDQPDLASMTAQQVQDFVCSLGSAYKCYASKFRRVRGSKLVKMSEAQMRKLVKPKLHRNRLLMEVARHAQPSVLASLPDVDVLNWSANKVSEWLSKKVVVRIYADEFADHGVDGLLLFELDAKDLCTIGVKQIHQRRVLSIIARFAKSTFPSFKPIDAEKDSTDKTSCAKGLKRRPSVPANILDSVLALCPNAKGAKGLDLASLTLRQVQDLVRSLGSVYMRVEASAVDQNNDIVSTMGQLLTELRIRTMTER